MSAETTPYHRALPLTGEQLERMCSPRVYRFAWQYAKSAHMTNRMRVGSSLSAKFHGTRGIYNTKLDLGDRQLKFNCDCPLAGSKEPCKHVVALGLAWLHEPETFHDLDMTLAQLANANKSELITLLRHVANRLPDVIPLLDRSRL
jgi:uncharacterized Zn finger protein